LAVIKTGPTILSFFSSGEVMGEYPQQRNGCDADGIDGRVAIPEPKT
jgi:hypothetical protein